MSSYRYRRPAGMQASYGNSYPYYQDKKEKDFSLRSNPLKKHKRPHFLMWSFILQLKHPLVQQTKIG